MIKLHVNVKTNAEQADELVTQIDDACRLEQGSEGVGATVIASTGVSTLLLRNFMKFMSCNSCIIIINHC